MERQKATQAIIADQVQEKLGSFAAGAFQQMALISKYEKAVASCTKDLSAEARQRIKKFSCASKLASRAIANVLNQSTKYDLPTGYLKQVNMIRLASERPSVELMQDAKQIEYVLEQVRALQQGGFAKETWKDSLASWIAFFDLYKQVNAQCALAVFECIAADSAVAEAIGAAAPFIELDGELPATIMVKLNKGPAEHIRKQAYKYITRLERDLNMITKIKETQARIIALIGAAITAALVSVGNFIARLGHDVQRGQGASRHDRHPSFVICRWLRAPDLGALSQLERLQGDVDRGGFILQGPPKKWW